MDKEKVNEKDGKARRTNAVEEVERFYISPDYDLDLCPGTGIGDTGRLDIGKVLPRDASLPWFGIRWDERATAIDVDVYHCTPKEKDDFEKGKAGYHGHHTTATDRPGRVVDLELIWRGQPVYHGHIRCTLGRELAMSGIVNPVGHLSVKVEKTCRMCGRRFTVVHNEVSCSECRGYVTQSS